MQPYRNSPSISKSLEQSLAAMLSQAMKPASRCRQPKQQGCEVSQPESLGSGDCLGERPHEANLGDPGKQPRQATQATLASYQGQWSRQTGRPGQGHAIRAMQPGRCGQGNAAGAMRPGRCGQGGPGGPGRSNMSARTPSSLPGRRPFTTTSL